MGKVRTLEALTVGIPCALRSDRPKPPRTDQLASVLSDRRRLHPGFATVNDPAFQMLAPHSSFGVSRQSAAVDARGCPALPHSNEMPLNQSVYDSPGLKTGPDSWASGVFRAASQGERVGGERVGEQEQLGFWIAQAPTRSIRVTRLGGVLTRVPARMDRAERRRPARSMRPREAGQRPPDPWRTVGS